MTMLCNPDDSVLLVIDTQTRLMPAIHEGQGVVRRCVLLATAAHELGIHVIGTGASELVHIGQAFLQSNANAWQIAETLYNYPTLSDLYRHAALEGIAARHRSAPARQAESQPSGAG